MARCVSGLKICSTVELCSGLTRMMVDSLSFLGHVFAGLGIIQSSQPFSRSLQKDVWAACTQYFSPI